LPTPATVAFEFSFPIIFPGLVQAVPEPVDTPLAGNSNGETGAPEGHEAVDVRNPVPPWHITASVVTGMRFTITDLFEVAFPHGPFPNAVNVSVALPLVI